MFEKNKISIICLFLLFCIAKINSQCNFVSLNPTSQFFNIECKEIETLIFYPEPKVTDINFNITFSNLTKLPRQLSIVNYPPPYVISFPDVETYGGIRPFKGYFFLKYDIDGVSIDILNIKESERFEITFEYDNNLDEIIYYYNVPRGSCSFNFAGSQFYYQLADFNTPLQNPKEGLVTIYGKNLFGITFNIKDELFTKSIDITDFTFGINDTSAQFSFNDFKYSGLWTIKISQCGKTMFNNSFLNEPKINQLSFVPAAGGTVTITGKYIYPRDGNIANIKISLKKNSASTTVNCNDIKYDISNAGRDEIITCEIPPKNEGPNEPQTLTISVNKLEANSTFYYGQPSISNIEYNENEVMIYCINYPSKTTSVRVKVPFGYSNYLENSFIKEFNVINTTQPNDKETSGIIYAQLPLYSIPGYLSLLFDNFTLESQIYNKFMLEPKISGISKSSTTGGKISIFGSSLFINNYQNQTIEDSYIQINGKECNQNENGNGSYITCLYEEGSGKNLPFSIIINGTEYNTDDIKFSYEPPSITDFIQNFNDNTISIIGNNFGNSNQTAVVYFNKNYNEKVYIRSISHQYIIIDIKNEFYGNYTIQTLIGEGVHAQDTDRPFLGPVLPIITNVTNVDCAGGIVNITGQYLNKDMQISFKSSNDKIKRKPIPCIIINNQITNNKFIQCQVFGRNGQEGNSTTFTSGKNFSVIAVNGDKEGYTDGTSFSFNPPTINFSYNFTKDIANQISTIKFDCKNINRYGLKLFIDDVECNNIQIELPFTVLSCSYPSLKSLGYISINKTIWNSKISKINITVDGQTSNFEASIFNFQENIEPPKASLNYLAAVAVCGAIAVGTIIAIIVYKYKRYKRIQKINKILKNPDIYNLTYQTQNNINSVS